MADFFTHFSCLLDVRTPENAARALEIYNRLMKENAAEDPPSEAFLLSIQPEHGGTQLWIRDDTTGDPQAVIDFVLRCAEQFGLIGRWGFQWANTCSRPRVNGTDPDDFTGFAIWSGTSFAAPAVAGAIARVAAETGLPGRAAAQRVLDPAHRRAIPGLGLAVIDPGESDR